MIIRDHSRLCFRHPSFLLRRKSMLGFDLLLLLQSLVADTQRYLLTVKLMLYLFLPAQRHQYQLDERTNEWKNKTMKNNSILLKWNRPFFVPLIRLWYWMRYMRGTKKIVCFVRSVNYTWPFNTCQFGNGLEPLDRPLGARRPIQQRTRPNMNMNMYTLLAL